MAKGTYYLTSELSTREKAEIAMELLGVPADHIQEKINRHLDFFTANHHLKAWEMADKLSEKLNIALT